MLYVDPVSSFLERALTVLGLRKKEAGPGIDQDFAAIRALAPADGQPSFSKVADRRVVPAILSEASKGYDLIVLGASAVVGGLSGSLFEDLVEGAPCHLAVMMPVGDRPEYKHLLVPLDGSVFSRAAVDFAVLLAEKTGAAVTLLFLSERRPQAVAWADLDSSTDATWHIAQAENPQGLMVAPAPAKPASEGQPRLSEEDAMLERISNVFKASKVKPTILARSYDPLRSAVAVEARSGKYDLIVVGAENRAIRNRLFFGYENERLLKEAPVSVLMIVPKIGAGKPH